MDVQNPGGYPRTKSTQSIQKIYFILVLPLDKTDQSFTSAELTLSVRKAGKLIGKFSEV